MTASRSLLRAVACVVVLLSAAGASHAAVVTLNNPGFDNNPDNNANTINGWGEFLEAQPDSMAQIAGAFQKPAGDLVARLGYKFDDVSLRQLTGQTYGSGGYTKWLFSIDALATTDIGGATPVGAAVTQAFQMIFTANNVNIKTVNLAATNVWQTYTIELTANEVLAANAAGQNIELRLYKGASTANFVMLDNARLASIPAPAALPAGLALLGVLGLRRRRRPA